MFIIIIAIITLPIALLLPFGIVIWFIGLCLALIGRSARKTERIANRVADRQSREMRTVLRVTNPEAALALEASDRAAKREDRAALRAAIGIVVVLLILGALGAYH